jgi:hypothetical protein
MSVTYTATLPMRAETAAFIADLLDRERTRRGTRTGTRALTCLRQAVLILRWFLDSTRIRQLAISRFFVSSTRYWPHDQEERDRTLCGESLLDRLADSPTPAGPTPRKIGISPTATQLLIINITHNQQPIENH